MIRRAMRRGAAIGLALVSVSVLATCDLAKLSGTDTTDATLRLDSTDLTLAGGTGVVLGGTITMSITSSVDLSGTAKRWSSSAPAIVRIDSVTGVASGLAIGSATITGRVMAPELSGAVSRSQLVTVRYAGIRVTAPVATDSISGLGQSRTVTVQGTNNAGVVQAGALSTGLTLTSSDATIFQVSGSTIVAKKNGSARIIAVYQTLRDSVLIKVRQVARKISFPGPDSLNYTAGALNTDLTVPLTVRDVADSVIATPVLTWRVVDTTVATIGATSGILRVKKVDTTRIFARMDTVERGQKLLVVLPPTAPTGLIATTASKTQINLSWTDNSSTETAFRIERCSGVSCTSFAEIATVAANVTTYSSTGLTANTAYSYRVRASNTGGNSAYTATASATTLPNAPTAPSGLTATAVSATQINLAWTDNSSDETGFDIDRCSGVSCTVFSPMASVSANSVSFSNSVLTPGTSYSYRIRAINAGGTSANTATATAVTPANSVDLIVNAFTVTGSVVPIGGTAVMSTTTRNQGGVASGAFNTAIYFSTDAIITTADAIGSVCPAASGLAALTNATCSGAASVPSLTPGTYFVGALADYQGTVAESNESNNASSTVTVTAANPDLMTNGNFSASGASWTLLSSVVTINNSALSYSASIFASLLTDGTGTGLNSATGSLYQDVFIPAGVSAATLEFRYNISTDETTTSILYDVLTVTVRNTSNTILSTVATYSNLNKSAGTGSANYALKTFDMTGFKGQTVRIHFNASSDVTLPTVFRIDDVKLTWSP